MADERDRIAAALHASDEWRRAFDAVPDLIAVLDARHRVVRVNRAMADRLGRTPAEVVGMRCHELVHGTEAPPASCPHSATLSDHCEHCAEICEPRLGGDFLVTTTPILDAERRPAGSVHVARDITERRRLERQLAWLASFPGSNPSPVVETDLAGNVTYRNAAADRLLPGLAELGPAHAWLADLPALAEAARTGEGGARREVTVDGRVYEQAVYRVEEGPRLRIYGRDVTDRSRVEAALRESEEKYRLLFQNMAEGFALYELVRDGEGRAVDWRVLEVNDAYERHTGLARERVVGRRVGELFPDAVPEYLPLFARVVATQQPASFETFARGVGRHQQVFTFPAGGDRFANTLNDITGRKRAEEDLLRANEDLERRVEERTARLRAVSAELLTAGQRERRRLADYLHDHLQQILVGARLSLGILQMRTRSGRLAAALRQVEERLGEAIAASRSLTVELSPPILSTAGLPDALAWLGERFGEEHGLAVQVRASRGADLAEHPVRALLFQSVRELLFNVVKHAGVREARLRLSRVPGGRIRVVVQDAGRGFDPAAARTTPADGGFGLWSIRERMENLAGALEIRSAPGRGTLVALTLPAGAPPPAPAGARRRAPSSRRRP